MDKEKRTTEETETKAQYTKPLIKRTRLVAGEAVLGSCKYNNGVKVQCGMDGVCIDATQRS